MPGVSCEQGTLEVGGVGPQDTEVVMAMSGASTIILAFFLSFQYTLWVECPDGDSGVGAATTSTAGTPAPSSNTTHESTTRDGAPYPSHFLLVVLQTRHTISQTRHSCYCMRARHRASLLPSIPG